MKLKNKYTCKLYPFTLLFLSISFLASESKSKDLDIISKRGIIRMAADKTLEPWIYENVKTGEFSGFEYEYALKLVKLIDPKLKLEVVNGEWAKLPQDVRAGKADFVLNAWFRPPQKEIPSTDSWTQCYYNTGFSIMYDSKEKETPTIKTLQKKGITIGIYPDPAPIKILAKYDIHKYKKSKEHEQYKNFIVNDVVDYFFFDAPAAQYQAKISKGLIKSTSSLPGTEDCYGIMVRKDSPKLLNAFNKAIGDLDKEKVMLSISKKYGIE